MQTNGQVVLVIDPDEEDQYIRYKDTPKMVVPEDCVGIGPKRKYIVENTDDSRIVMLDDDLRFYIRKSPTN